MPPPPFTVAFVCTGNRFRSPLGAAAFGVASAHAGVRVESYGTLDLGGAPALDEALEEAAARGLDLSAHESRPLRTGVFASTDLVVGFERAHIVAAVVDGGARRERAFTLPELVQLLAQVRAVGADGAIAAAARLRPGDLARWSPAEIADPLGAPRAEQRKIAQRVNDLSRELADRLFGRASYASRL